MGTQVAMVKKIRLWREYYDGKVKGSETGKTRQLPQPTVQQQVSGGATRLAHTAVSGCRKAQAGMIRSSK